MSRLNIEYVPISLLKPRSNNARTHSNKQIEQLAASIRSFGFCNPALADDNGQIIAGHGRIEAAHRAGLKEIPVVRLSHLNEAERRAYVLADNRLAELAGWDRELLAIEFRELIDLGFEIELTGFETAVVDLTIDEIDKSKATPEDIIPKTGSEFAVSRPGDIWCLGPHRVTCGDARDASTFVSLMEGRQADLVFTDPPYNVSIEGHVSGLGKVKHGDFAMACGEMSEKDFISFLSKTIGHATKHSRAGAVHYICMDWRHVFETISACRVLYDQFLNLCVWNKSNGGMGSFYRSKHELVLVFRVGSKSHVNNIQLGKHGRYRTNVWDYAGVNSFGKTRSTELSMHPTVKPVALVADAIKDASRRNDLVLDPFGGSGTTLIAADKVGRVAALLEYDPNYVDVIVQRWEKLTGNKAFLSIDKSSFEVAAAKRKQVKISSLDREFDHD